MTDAPATPALADLFFDRACVIAQRVYGGELPILDAVDMLHSAAEWSGLIDRLGEDEVQRLMAQAFEGNQ